MARKTARVSKLAKKKNSSRKVFMGKSKAKARTAYKTKQRGANNGFEQSAREQSGVGQGRISPPSDDIFENDVA